MMPENKVLVPRNRGIEACYFLRLSYFIPKGYRKKQVSDYPLNNKYVLLLKKREAFIGKNV